MYSHHYPCTWAERCGTRGAPGLHPARHIPVVASPWLHSPHCHWTLGYCRTVTGKKKRIRIKNTTMRKADSIFTNKESYLKAVINWCEMSGNWSAPRHADIPVTLSDALISSYKVSSMKMNQHLRNRFLERQQKHKDRNYGLDHTELQYVELKDWL